jgi:hypothetical protein
MFTQTGHERSYGLTGKLTLVIGFPRYLISTRDHRLTVQGQTDMVEISRMAPFLTGLTFIHHGILRWEYWNTDIIRGKHPTASGVKV